MGLLSSRWVLVCTAGLVSTFPFAAGGAPLQDNSTLAERDAPASVPTAESPGADAGQGGSSGPGRTELNLLGRTDASAGERPP